MDSHSYSDHRIQPCIHYVETLPSVLQEMPWVHQVKHKVCVINCYRIDCFAVTCKCHCLVASMQLSDMSGLKEEVQKICQQQAIVERGLDCVKVVYGPAGQYIISVYDVNLIT